MALGKKTKLALGAGGLAYGAKSAYEIHNLVKLMRSMGLAGAPPRRRKTTATAGHRKKKTKKRC
jgi:hypothetical protein